MLKKILLGLLLSTTTFAAAYVGTSDIKDGAVTTAKIASGVSITGSLTGNADTATAFASAPTGCSSGEFAHGIDVNGNLTCSTVDGLPDQTGNSGKFLTTDGTSASWATVSSGSGTDNSKTFAVTSHGFSIGDVLYHSTTWQKAKADADVTGDALCVVTAVPDADDFTCTFSGYITTFSGLTADTTYFLSDATAGLLTATAPTTVGHVKKAMLYAISSTTGVVLSRPGWVLAEAATPSNVTSASLGNMRLNEAVTTCGPSSASVSSQSGTWITAATANGSDRCTYTIATGEFSSSPVCIPVLNNGTSGGDVNIHIVSTSATSVVTQCRSSSSDCTGTDTYMIICFGSH